jgi:hypothetical protein
LNRARRPKRIAPESRIAAEQVQLRDLEQKAVRADLLPDLEFVGDYGASGVTPDNEQPAHAEGGRALNVPISTAA